ncbi:MAG: L-seryl-tRNA(Sec) selenium transferase [Aquificales bacterium]|nr:L-seryl-tRNA(Sec) selenium transferase [Aquificales bacterium]
MTKKQRNKSNKEERLRQLPSMDKLLRLPVTIELIADYGRSLTLQALRTTLDEQRTAVLNNAPSVPANERLAQTARDWLENWFTPTLRPVINATGVIVHTNLGRAPLSEAAIAAVTAVAQNYSTLEFSLETGKRGSRAIHAEQLLTQLTDTEAALTVNNNAAAVLLMLSALCQGKEVIISRSQLVEIGGGFRIPDVMAQSGAKLVEVGTTNRTHLRDYENAINENTGSIFVAHQSNFKIVGFTTEPELADLAELAHAHNIPLLYDQGSGALFDTSEFGLAPEPTVLAGLQAGCDIVAFSGDKLLGGPQAGILCGNAELLAIIKKHPLARAVRADKMALAALSATLTLYLKEQALEAIPIWRMISRPLEEITEEAEAWATQFQEQGIGAQTIAGESTVGGGSLPGTAMPTQLVAITHADVAALAAGLRENDPPVIGRIQDGRYLIDPRTILPSQIKPLLGAIIQHNRL